VLKAVEYLGPVGIGATSPQLFRADNGKTYIVKLQNNRLGPKVLVNELMAAKLGEILNLCFPPSFIIRLDEELIKKSVFLVMNKVKPGLHFACQYLNHTGYVDRHHLFRAVNKEELAGVMLFDHLFHNLDRTWNRRNLLIRKESAGYKIYAIDNSHLFKRGVWSTKLLEKLVKEIEVNRRRAYGLLLKHFFNKQHFDGYIQKIQQLTNEQLAAIIESIPYEWLSDEQERSSLLNYLIERRDMVNVIAEKLYAYMSAKRKES
jgi:hypothetical protein